NTVSGTTDASGQATFTVASTVAEAKTVSVTAPAGLSGVTSSLTFVAPTASSSTSTISASIANVLNDNSATSTITVTLKDSGGFAISGATAAISSSGTGNTIAPASATTNASGQASFTIKSTVAQAKTISISTPALTPTTSVTFVTPVSISPSSVTLAVGNSTTFSATGGTGSYTYSIFAGSGSMSGATYT